MTTVNACFSTQYCQYFCSAKQSAAKSKGPEQTSTAQSSRIPREKSTVTDFIRKHPDREKNVMDMVRAGKSVRETYGLGEADTSGMSMAEYKTYITGLLGKIPFDASRPHDEETVFISEEGWEQMKNDPEYEAWVLGYTKINRSVRFPYALGSTGSYAVEHFGASIEEHEGHSYSKMYGGSPSAARNLFRAESGGGTTYRASGRDEYDEILEEKRLKNKKLQEERREQKTRQQKEYREMRMKEWMARSAYRDDARSARTSVSIQSATASYEAGFFYQNVFEKSSL